MRPMQRPETFPDGEADIYEDAGRKLGRLKVTLRFEKQSVGVNRYYQASISSARIDRVIKVPHTEGHYTRMDLVKVRGMDGGIYRIKRIQEKPERGVDLLELESAQAAIKENV